MPRLSDMGCTSVSLSSYEIMRMYIYISDLVLLFNVLNIDDYWKIASFIEGEMHFLYVLLQDRVILIVYKTCYELNSVSDWTLKLPGTKFNQM